ncbi:MAG: hypothetical protein WCJ81_04340 [bacterium]
MKKIKLIISITVCTLLIASCSTTKKTAVTPVVAQKETIGQKYDHRFSAVLDSLVLSIQKIEDGVGNDTASVATLIQREMKQYGDSIYHIMNDFIPEWSKYVRDSTGEFTKTFVPIKITGAYTTVPRVSEIVTAKVERNGKSKGLNAILTESIELGKKGYYFLRGDNMKYHYTSPVFSEIGYYDNDATQVNNDSAMMASISRFFVGRPSLSSAKFIEKKSNGRVIYNAAVAKEYWVEYATWHISNYLYSAILDNIAWRHSRQ